MVNNVDKLLQHFPTGGECESLTKDIIKVANAKLVLADEYKSQYESFKAAYELKVKDCILADSIIAKQKAEIKRISIICNNTINDLSVEKDKSKRYKKQRNVAIGASTIIIVISSLLLK